MSGMEEADEEDDKELFMETSSRDAREEVFNITKVTYNIIIKLIMTIIMTIIIIIIMISKSIYSYIPQTIHQSDHYSLNDDAEGEP